MPPSDKSRVWELQLSGKTKVSWLHWNAMKLLKEECAKNLSVDLALAQHKATLLKDLREDAHGLVKVKTKVAVDAMFAEMRKAIGV